jgi:hypothetical protein
MSRLTDERIDEIELFATMNTQDVQKWLSSRESLAMAAELKERRAGELTEEDREALVRLRNEMRNSERRSPDIMYYPAERVRAREVIDRLLANRGAK